MRAIDCKRDFTGKRCINFNPYSAGTLIVYFLACDITNRKCRDEQAGALMRETQDTRTPAPE